MGRKVRNYDEESAILNNETYLEYYDRLTELSLSMFEWTNLPPSIDPRFLELTLFSEGQAVFFKDDVLGFLALQVTTNGKLDIYRVPTKRRAYSTSGYQMNLDESNSVIIYNNLLHKPSERRVRMFSRRLYNLDRTIDVNANAQKTPVLIQCDEEQRLTLENVYAQYDGNKPVIFGNKGLDVSGVKTIQTGATFVCDKLYELKTEIWNEALTYLGISNINVVKKERMITDEVTRNQGGVIASRYSRLESRREACKKINAMFNLDIWCNYREDYENIVTVESDTNGTGGNDNE